MSDGGFDLSDVWKTLPPQEQQKALASVLKLGGLNKQSSDLDQQIQDAQAMQASAPQHHYGAIGGAIGGLGEALRGISGTLLERKLRGEQKPLQAQIEGGRGSLASALFSGGQGMPAQAAPGADAPPMLRGTPVQLAQAQQQQQPPPDWRSYIPGAGGGG